MNVALFPQKKTDEMTSLMAILKCDDCHDEWVGLFQEGMALHCPFCQSESITNRQGERLVIFYDYRDKDVDGGGIA